MTHDELLETLQRIGLKTNGAESAALYLALRAVVELHKPWTATEDDMYWGGFRLELGEQCCPACAMPSAYPCPTIQQIQEQLK